MPYVLGPSLSTQIFNFIPCLCAAWLRNNSESMGKVSKANINNTAAAVNDSSNSAVYFITLLMEELLAHLMLCNQMTSRFHFGQNLNHQAFSDSRRRLAATDGG
jgi:hypothetical protein